MARATAEHIQIIQTSLFNRLAAPTETLVANCTSGYRFRSPQNTAALQAQYHHILCIQALQDSYIEPDTHIPFFHKCMAITPWDINDGDNLIGLPTKQIYIRAEAHQTGVSLGLMSDFDGLANQLAQSAGFGAIPDLPCHQSDHNKYFDAVVDYLKQNVWEPLADEQEDCNIDPKNIKAMLEQGSIYWRMFLMQRGRAHGGASHCWTNRNRPAYRNVWYIPFSMDPGAPAFCHPPPPVPSRNVAVKAWLSNLFSS